MTEAGSIPVSAQALELLAVQARRNGTQSAFIDIALQWALQASQEIDRLTRERDEARAERDAMAKDAARYRWLRGSSCPDHSRRWTLWAIRHWRAPFWTGDLRHGDLDAAVDAQIEQERSEQVKARLDWLEAQINEHGEIHLHDGDHPRGTGLGLRPGYLRRTLREAIDSAMGSLAKDAEAQ